MYIFIDRTYATRRHYPLSSVWKQWFMLVSVSTVHHLTLVHCFPVCFVPFQPLSAFAKHEGFFLTLSPDRNYMLFDPCKQSFFLFSPFLLWSWWRRSFISKTINTVFLLTLFIIWEVETFEKRFLWFCRLHNIENVWTVR